MPSTSYVVAVVKDFRVVGFLGAGRRFVQTRSKAHAFDRETKARRALSSFVGDNGEWTDVRQVVGSLRAEQAEDAREGR